MFSRQIGRDCTYCHTLVPKLNETGRVFRSNGFRFEEEGEWKGIRDYTVLPVSFEAEVEALYNRTTAGGVKTEDSDLKIEEVEVMAGGALGKEGRVSALALVAVEETTSGAEVVIPRAFIQVNDLAGSIGSGMLNVRAGKWDVGLPFLNAIGQVIGNRYLADTTLRLISPEDKGLEVNGSVISYREEDSTAHRYAVGLVREDLNDDDRLKGYYAWYSVTFNDTVSLGAIYRGGREKNGLVDVSYNKYGFAGEVEAGPFVFSAGYFGTARPGLPERTDYLAEVIFIPLPKFSFAGRFELLKENGKRGVKSQSFMVRYHILSNVYAQAELRGINDDDRVAGSNEDEIKLRLFLVALF